MRNGRLLLSIIGAGLIAFGCWQIGSVAVVHAKAWLAPVLIERAWGRALAGHDGSALKPWPWADMVPALHVQFPQSGETLHALGGATARAMAFGPVLDETTATPVLFGHRDSHFRFLETVGPGEEMIVERSDGTIEAYTIIETAVRHKDYISVPLGDPGDYFALVTCYPFDAADANGPMRYVLLAQREVAD